MINTILHLGRLISHQFRDLSVSAKRSTEWPRVEKQFLSEHPICEACGSKTRLNVHHIVPFHIDRELELDTNNLITLCMSVKECHFKLGHGQNWRDWNPNVKQDVILLNTGKITFADLVDKIKKTASKS